MTNKKQGYRFGVKWIAENDEPEALDAEEVSGRRPLQKGLLRVLISDILLEQRRKGIP